MSRSSLILGAVGLGVERVRQRAGEVSTRLAIRRGTLSMGAGTYGHPAVISMDSAGTVTIGSYCSIAPDVVFHLGGDHRTDWVTTYPPGLLGLRVKGHPASKGSVTVGSDVWIARGAKILSGVTIGSGAVIGAYAVVTSDVRPYAVVVGNPAREVKRRFSDEIVDELLDIRWWDLPVQELRTLPLWEAYTKALADYVRTRQSQ